MSLLYGYIITRLSFPVRGEGLVVVNVEFPCGIVGHVEQFIFLGRRGSDGAESQD